VRDFVEIGRIIRVALGHEYEAARADLARRVETIADRFPLYAGRH
jgi:hypothetical protein